MNITGSNLYKSIIFDLDGTLMNTKSGILTCLACILEKNGLPPVEKSREMKFIGPPMRQALKAEYGLSDDDAFEAAQEFRALYAESYAMMARTYPAMKALLATLKEQGCKLSVATYKREDVAKRLLKQHKLDGFFDVIKGSDFEGKLTKRSIVENAINAVNVSAKNTVIIGDSTGDGMAAKQVGADFIAVTYGFGFHCDKDFEGITPIAVCNSVKDFFNACYKVRKKRKTSLVPETAV